MTKFGFRPTEMPRSKVNRKAILNLAHLFSSLALLGFGMAASVAVFILEVTSCGYR